MAYSIPPTGSMDAVTTVAFLASALPALKGRSLEAAALIESAVRECILTVAQESGEPHAPVDLAAYLNYAVEDVARISPAGAGMVLKAVCFLRE